MKKTLLIAFLLIVCTWSVSMNDLMKQGIALRDSGKYEEAILKFQEILKSKPKHAEANYEMGVTYLRIYDGQNALSFLNNAFKFGYNPLKTHIALGTAHQMVGNGQEAIIEYQLAMEIKPNSPELHNLLGDAYMQKSGSTGIALTEYETALEFDSLYVPAIVGIGNYYRAQRKTDEAIAQYEKAKKVDPKYAQTYLQLGTLLMEKKIYDKSLSELARYVELVPRDPKGYIKIAEVYEKSKDYTNAIKYMKGAIALGDTSLGSLKFMSFLYDRARLFAENKEILARILQRAPEDVYSWTELAKSYAMLDSAQMAIYAYQRALNLDPSKLSSLSFTLGLAYYQIAKYDSAVIMFTQKIALDSLAAGAHINRALCYIQLKKYDRARADLEKGIALQPNHVQAHLWLGGIYAFQGLKAKAKTEYKKVLELDPKNKEAKQGIADLNRVAAPPRENYNDYIDDEYLQEDTLQP